MTKTKRGIELTIRPVTRDLWPALEVGKSGASNGCWCMYWRLGRAYRDRPKGLVAEPMQLAVRDALIGLTAAHHSGTD